MHLFALLLVPPFKKGGLRGISLLLLLTTPAFAQDRCEDALREAERNYRTGRIEEVLAVEEACLDGRASPRERARAWALMAKVYVTRDETEKAAAAVRELVALDPGFQPGRLDPVAFAELVEKEKAAAFTVQVGSVSKTDEPLREAPATVVVVTAEEIERRGYLDLEEVLHDLPGFDISRGNGDVYSNVYMRGYRSDRSDRMLFLVDGVEHNDLHSNTAYISRQYPLSNVERIEVVYGPASTIYGANAFTGVISITTKAPVALFEDDRNLGFDVQAGSGSLETRFVDATVAGRTSGGRLSWSLTGRSYRSDEQDLSGFDDWDYDFSRLADLDYREVMRLEGALARELAEFCELLPAECQLVMENGEVVAIEPTPFGAELARQLDLELFEALEGQAQEFSDPTDDWAIDAKLQIQNLTLGLQTWRREEGTAPWHTDFLRAGSRQNVRTPRQTTIYARYSHPLGGNLLLSLFSRFKQHETDSSVARLVTSAGKSLNIIEVALFTPPAFQEITFDQKSSQIRNELTLIYQPSRRFNLISGIELRNSSVQLEFESSILDHIQPPDFVRDLPFFETQVTSSKSEVTDLGIFAQASYKPREDWKIVVGGRVDSNSVRNEAAFLLFDLNPTGEFSAGECGIFNLGPFPCDLESRGFEVKDSGTVFNPRLALVHTRGDFVVKAIYAEAFKEPSNFQKFTREPGLRDFQSPELEPEKVRNFELGLRWQPREDLFIDFVAYQANYTNSVALTQTIKPDLNFLLSVSTDNEFKNIGRLRIEGVQLNASAKYRRYDFYGNYTYTEPFNTDPVDELGDPLPDVDKRRIGDIAGHRLNLGVNAAFGESWNLNLRTNWVGDRKTGATTTVVDNPFDEIDSYFVAHATLGYRGFPAGAKWQLVVRNLFDAEYFHPGVQRAGAGFASRLPQPGRTVFLRFSYRR